LAQKSHKVYQRESFANLQQSLDRLFEHYLLINQHYQNVSVFIFHTGDINNDNLQLWEQRSYPQETWGTIQLINLNNTPYWQTPSHIQEQDLSTWHNTNFNLGYRHMQVPVKLTEAVCVHQFEETLVLVIALQITFHIQGTKLAIMNKLTTIRDS
jgi:hypothetical protein